LLAARVWPAAVVALLAARVSSAVALACSEVGQGAVARSEAERVWFQVVRACSVGSLVGFGVDWVWLPAGPVWSGAVQGELRLRLRAARVVPAVCSPVAQGGCRFDLDGWALPRGWGAGCLDLQRWVGWLRPSPGDLCSGYRTADDFERLRAGSEAGLTWAQCAGHAWRLFPRLAVSRSSRLCRRYKRCGCCC
jgi:hypothetical protein